MSDCEAIEGELSAWIDGELGARDAARVSEHVAGCAACERRRTMLLVTGSLVRSLADDDPRERLHRRWPFVLAAAAMLVAGIGAAYLWRSKANAPPACSGEGPHCPPPALSLPGRPGDVARKP